MSQQKYNSGQITGLSILWSVWLMGLQFAYLMGREEGFSNAVDAMVANLPLCIPILVCTLGSAKSLKGILVRETVSRRHVVLVGGLCLLFFPIGLLYLAARRRMARG